MYGRVDGDDVLAVRLADLLKCFSDSQLVRRNEDGEYPWLVGTEHVCVIWYNVIGK